MTPLREEPEDADAPAVVDLSSRRPQGSNASGGIIILGRAGLTRDVVEHIVSSGGRLVVDLRAIEEDPEMTIVAVLVEPSDDDWRTVEQIGARAVAVIDRVADDDRMIATIMHGADAVLTTAAEPSDVIDAIDVVAAGEAHLTPRQARAVLERLRTMRPAASTPQLTMREQDILLSIERGESIKQTARSLEISEKTVQNVQSRLFRKLAARNRAQAVARAHELGLLDTAGASS